MASLDDVKMEMEFQNTKEKYGKELKALKTQHEKEMDDLRKKMKVEMEPFRQWNLLKKEEKLCPRCIEDHDGVSGSKVASACDGCGVCASCDHMIDCEVVKKESFVQVESCSKVCDDGSIEIDGNDLMKLIKKEVQDKKSVYHSDWFSNEEGSKFPTHEELCANVPAFNYQGKYPDMKDPTFHCGWEISSLGFMWLIIAYDPKCSIAYGFVRMHCCEYGIIDMDEIREAFNKNLNSFKSLFAFRETFKKGSMTKSIMQETTMITFK